MIRLDRYILRQLVAALGFFVLVFTGVIWLTQAVRLIDTVIASGQSAQTFVLFSLLVLPQVLVIVLPLAGIGAALFAINKLYGESELVVMMASGMSPWTMLRPVALFGLLVGLVMAVVMMVIVPRSGAILADQTKAIRSDLANALIVERQFLHPTPGLTLFITDTKPGGEMSGIFLNDERDPARPVTYSAERARLVREGMQARLVMFEGVALGTGEGGNLTSVRFDRFVFDLSDLLKDEARVPRPSEYPVTALLWPTPEMLAGGRYSREDFVSEGHYKLTMPLLAFVYPMIALATLLAGSFRRGGFGRRVVIAIVVAALLQVVMFAMRAQTQGNAGLWPLMYIAPALGLFYVGLLLRRQTRPRCPPRGVAA